MPFVSRYVSRLAPVAVRLSQMGLNTAKTYTHTGKISQTMPSHGSAERNGALRIRSGLRNRTRIAFTPGMVQVRIAIVIANQAVPARLSLWPVVARKCGNAL